MCCVLQFLFDGLPGDRDSMDEEVWVTPKNSFSHLPSAGGDPGSVRRPGHSRCPKHAAAEYIATHLLHHNHHPSAVGAPASLHNQGASLHNHSQMGPPTAAAPPHIPRGASSQDLATQHLLHHHHLHHSTHALHGGAGGGAVTQGQGVTSKLTSAGGPAAVVNNPAAVQTLNSVAAAAAAKKLYSLPEHTATHHSLHSVC